MTNERNAIKRALRQAFPGVQFSLKHEWPIRVEWPDGAAGPTVAQAETVMLATGLVEIDTSYFRPVLRLKPRGSNIAFWRYDADKQAALQAKRQAAIGTRGPQPDTITARVRNALQARFADCEFGIKSSRRGTLFTHVGWNSGPLESEVEAVLSELFGDEVTFYFTRSLTCPECRSDAVFPDGKGGFLCAACDADACISGAVA